MLIGVLVIILFISIHNYRNKKNLIKKNGLQYKDAYKLNNEYEFKQYKKKYYIDYSLKSKRTLENTDLSDIVIYYLENNINGFKNNFEIARENQKNYLFYNSKFDGIIQKEYEYREEDVICKEFKTIEKFMKFEKKIVKKLKKKNDFYFDAKIKAQYTSPQGRNRYWKEAVFKYPNILQCYEKWKRVKEYKISSKIERAKMSDSLRYDILLRDNFKCKICGATASEGTKLHVDHIIPVSKGGKTEVNNLQTLCERCNLGKSNKL